MNIMTAFRTKTSGSRAYRALTICAAIGLATACGFRDQPARAASSDVVTAQGTKLYFDGKPFEGRGVEYIATVAPPDWLRSGGPNGTGYPGYLTAYERFASSARSSFQHARSYFGA